MPEAALIGGSMLGAAAISKDGGGGKISSVPTLTPGQMKLLDALTSMLTPRVGEGITPYQGARVPGVTPLQQGGFDIFSDYMPFAGEGITAMQDAFSRYNPEAAGQFQQMGADALSRVTQEFDPENITRALEPARQLGVKTFKEDIVPYITEHYAAGGDIKSSGAMNRSLSRAAEDLALQISSSAAPYYIQGYESNLNRNLAAVPEAYRMGMMPGDIVNQAISGFGGFPLDIAGQSIGAGGIQRGIEGEQIGAEQAKWTEAQPWMNPYLQQFLGPALGTQAVENVYQEGSPSMASLMAPVFGSLLGTYAGKKLFPTGANVNNPYTEGNLFNAMANPYYYGS